jgi:FtsZ-binding cell division protein ZapB
MYTHKDDLIERNAGLRSEIEHLRDRVEELEAENENLRNLLQEIQEGE